ncbi:hypothetical protein CcaverHIS002_0509290 [Cutaneotrichosporon cavernicola]|uniref:Uncharacterized protein n=1 Tax=Cutaneotrichosporon cavernicola TaxID=279322 RepID=A0AA48L7G1_9TREE|nr:uncharacterized protein CcaverHIS019_0509850 [Cutaneotrichosporon cavernicola]BEI85528.1 hypothetical protein CcaverHIS002_0509290 [Cutaneotrichosporon cavernicola]BEI93357.1 hypothetical protein CcaverHIS019_0509850 [Cutaneotrichosporon cavernicola]BEJ08904.1 hypothetical protein CcaverHIS641_0509980 [Cutaneotrichosporon cavernicola]
MAPSAREKELERQAFYRQLGETAKLSNTFVNPKTSNSQNFVGGSNSPLADQAARHTAPPMAPHPIRFGPGTVNNLTAEAARLQKHDISYPYAHHPQPAPQTPPHASPYTFVYSSPQLAPSVYEPQALSSRHEAREWEQAAPRMQVPQGDIQSFIATEIQRIMGQQVHKSIQPPQAQLMSDEERSSLLAYAEQCKAERDEVRALHRIAEGKADSAIKHQSQMAKNITHLERKLTDSEKALNSEREANRSLRRRIDEAESKSRKELDETKKRFNNALNEKHNLNERLSLANVEKEKSQDKVKMMRFDNKALDVQNAELRRQKIALEHQNTNVANQKDDLARQLVAVEAQLKQALRHKAKYTQVGQVEDQNELMSRSATTCAYNMHGSAVTDPLLNLTSPQHSSHNQAANSASAMKLAQVLHELQVASATSDPYQELGSVFK